MIALFYFATNSQAIQKLTWFRPLLHMPFGVLGFFFCFWLKIRRPSSTNFHSKPIDLENLGSLTFCDANQFIKSVTYYLNGPFLRCWNLKYYLSFKISPPPIRFDLQRRSWQNVQVYDDDPLKWQNWVKVKIFWD